MSAFPKLVRNARLLVFTGLAVGGWLHIAHALDPSTSDPHAIIRAAYAPPGLDHVISRMRMTIRADGANRTRVMTMRTKRFEGGLKSLLMLEEPADMRNTGLLAIDYSAKGKRDEQWLYLPHLHRVSRVPASGRADAFVGSDFSYADLGTIDPDDYDLDLVDSAANVDGEACWLIEATPRSDAVKKATGYTKFQTWVSKRTTVPMQSKLWTVTANRLKYLKAADVRNVDGVWTAHRYQMRTLDNGSLVSETIIDVLSIKPKSPDVTDDDFTQQRLARGV